MVTKYFENIKDKDTCHVDCKYNTGTFSIHVTFLRKLIYIIIPSPYFFELIK